MTWYTPPFKLALKTNIGKKLLELINENFPEGHILRKCVNRNCIKISYSCMKNMKQVFMSHIRKVLKPSEAAKKTTADVGASVPSMEPTETNH